MSASSEDRKLPQSEEFRSYRRIRWFGIGSIFIITIAIFLSIWFIYTNIYLTLDRAYSLLILRSDPTFSPIDFRLYDEVNQKWEQKQNQADLPAIRDIFVLPQVSTPTSTPSVPTKPKSNS